MISRGAKLFGPASVRQCRTAMRDLVRDRSFQVGMSAMKPHRQRRMAGAGCSGWPPRRWSTLPGPKACEIWLDCGHRCRGARCRGCGALGDLEERCRAAGGDRVHEGTGCECFPRQFRAGLPAIIAVRSPARDNAMRSTVLADGAFSAGVENAARVARLHCAFRLAYEAAADSDRIAHLAAMCVCQGTPC